MSISAAPTVLLVFVCVTLAHVWWLLRVSRTALQEGKKLNLRRIGIIYCWFALLMGLHHALEQWFIKSRPTNPLEVVVGLIPVLATGFAFALVTGRERRATAPAFQLRYYALTALLLGLPFVGWWLLSVPESDIARLLIPFWWLVNLLIFPVLTSPAFRYECGEHLQIYKAEVPPDTEWVTSSYPFTYGCSEEGLVVKWRLDWASDESATGIIPWSSVTGWEATELPIGSYYEISFPGGSIRLGQADYRKIRHYYEALSAAPAITASAPQPA